MNNERFRRHELYLFDERGKGQIIYIADTFEEMDAFTSTFDNKEHLLKECENKYNKKFVDVLIKSRKSKSTSLAEMKITTDIIYGENLIPSEEVINSLYTKYLLENKNRIRYSFIYHMPEFRGTDIRYIDADKLEFAVNSRKKNYKEIRNIYFQLLKTKKIRTRKRRNKKEDYLTYLIKNIDTSYDEIDPDNITEEKIEEISRAIMMEKIQNGEIEPSFYDLDDYHKGRRR